MVKAESAEQLGKSSDKMHNHEAAVDNVSHLTYSASPDKDNVRLISQERQARSQNDQNLVDKGIIPAIPDFSTHQSLRNNILSFGRTEEDGTKRSVTSDLKNNTTSEDVLHPDGRSEHIDQKPGFLETKSYGADKRIVSDDVAADKTTDGKTNFESHKYWDDKGKLAEDNQRWKDATGKWHEDSTMNFPNGRSNHRVMDGDVTTTLDTKPDGKWSKTVQTMNVDMVNPETGKHYKTMTIERTP